MFIEMRIWQRWSLNKTLLHALVEMVMSKYLSCNGRDTETVMLGLSVTMSLVPQLSFIIGQCSQCSANILESLNISDPAQALEPAEGQRCRGRNYDGKRCCTPEQPCQEGEGDCDGPGDGGLNDGHAGCKGDLVCGSNNCKKFGAYYHEKDDCCERATSPIKKSPEFDRTEKQGQ